MMSFGMTSSNSNGTELFEMKGRVEMCKKFGFFSMKVVSMTYSSSFVKKTDVGLVWVKFLTGCRRIIDMETIKDILCG